MESIIFQSYFESSHVILSLISTRACCFLNIPTTSIPVWQYDKVLVLQEALSQADRQLSKSQRQASHAGKRLRALESRDEQLQSLWASNKRMTWAARVIQRAYKSWRMRALQFENLSDKRVSYIIISLCNVRSTYSEWQGLYPLPNLGKESAVLC